MKNENESALRESWQALGRLIDGRCFIVERCSYNSHCAYKVTAGEADIDRLIVSVRDNPLIEAKVLFPNGIILWAKGLTSEIMGQGCSEEPWVREGGGGA